MTENNSCHSLFRYSIAFSCCSLVMDTFPLVIPTSPSSFSFRMVRFSVFTEMPGRIEQAAATVVGGAVQLVGHLLGHQPQKMNVL